MPRNVVAGPNLGNVRHGPLQLQVRVQLVRKLLPRARLSPLKLRSHVLYAREPPVGRIQIPRLLPPPIHSLEERSQQQVRRRQLHQRVHQQGPLPRPSMAHVHPALPHAKHGTRAQPVVPVIHRVDASTRIPSVVFFPAALEDGVVHGSPAVPFALPPLDAPAVHVRAQREGRVPGLPDAETVRVGQRLLQVDARRGGREVPNGAHEMVLHAEEVWVRAGFELRARPIELPDLGVVLRKGCVVNQSNDYSLVVVVSSVSPLVLGFLRTYSSISSL